MTKAHGPHKDLASDLLSEEDSERPGSDRRLAARYELNKRVQVQVEGQSSGRLVDISRQGGLFIESRDPLSFRTDVEVTMSLRNATQIVFTGRVVRVTERGFATHLRCPSEAREFMDMFIEQALDDELSVGAVVVKKTADIEDAMGRAELSAKWFVLRYQGGDEAEHQAFIDASMKSKQLSFALECYRAWKSDVPDNPIADKFLAHIAKIIGFYAFDRRPTAGGGDGMSRRTTLWMLILVLLASIIGLGAIVLPRFRRKADPGPNPAAPIR